MKRYAIVLAVLLGCAPAAAARQQSGISLSPVDPPRWDLSAEVGWLGSNKSEVAPEWDDWFDVPAAGVTLGYYWTPHLRSDLRVSFSGEARVLEEQQVRVPGQPWPIFRYREHLYRSRTVSSGLSWQFFDNRWFHPSLGGGLDVVGEREAGVGTTTTVRPFVSTGFKWYVNERAFARTDFRVSFRDAAAAHVTWTGGFGVDL